MNNQKEISLKAINTFGLNHQVIKTIEELAELQVELVRFSNGDKRASRDNIIEEVTDVLIMLDQIGYIFHFTDDERKESMDVKLRKLKRRMIEYDQDRI